MKLTISYRHMEGTPSIEEKIQSKAQHLKKYFEGKMDVKWTCTIDNHLHRSDVHIHANHVDFHASAENENLYKTFDDVIHKVERQAQKHKQESRIHRQSPSVSFSEPL